MKYIIDIPEEVKWIQGFKSTRFGIQDCVPMTVEDLEPYTEPDHKAIDLQHAHDIENVARLNYKKGAEDAWEFACGIDRAVMNMDWDENNKPFEDNPFTMSYSEAKAKHDAWSKQNIREGDEVIYDSRTKAVVLIPETKERYGTILTSEFATISVSHDDLEKTGRHFEDIAGLLKKIKENK